VNVRRVDTESTSDVQRFIQTPFDLYAGCSQWTPPLVGDLRFALNRQKHPFYGHSDAEFFIAERGGNAIGRIAAIDHRHYNEFHGKQAAFFYYFDALDDTEVSDALFEAAFAWARRRGLNEIIGPKGMMRSDGAGLLVEGFEYRPAIGIPYNHAYYEKLVAHAGFTKVTDYLSAHLTSDWDLPDRVYQIAEKIKARRGFWIKPFASKREMRRWLPRVQAVINTAFTHLPAHIPVTDEEMALTARTLSTVANPRLIKLVMKGDEIAGFLFAYPDISAGIQKARGKLWPLGWIHILREFRRTRWLNVNGLALLPKYQGMGANAVLYVELVNSLKSMQFEQGDLVQIDEANLASAGDVAALGARWHKRHRVYSRPL
jgi:hypothetical protein